MTDDRSLERAARSWLEMGPTQAPARAVEEALLRIETTPQERDLRIPRRFTQMSMTARLATAAVIGALAVGGVFYLLGPGRSSNVGGPGPSPSATLSSSPTPAPSLAFAPAPDRTLGDWQARADTDMPDIVVGASERIQLSIDWQDGMHAWIQTESGRQVLKSATIEAPAGELHFVTEAADEPDSLGCTAGQVGRYGWSRSADGMFLSLTPIDDQCAVRSAAFGRTWAHSLSAVTDGGLGIMPLEAGWVRMTLPSQRFGLSGNTGYAYLHAMEGPDRTFFAIKDPMGLDAPCSATRQVVPITSSTADIVAYLRSLPGFTVSTTDETVGGAPAVHATLTPKGAASCLGGEIPVFASRFATDPDREWTLTTGGSHSIWIVQRLDGEYVFIYEGAAVTPDEEATVVDSMTFLAQIPTP